MRLQGETRELPARLTVAEPLPEGRADGITPEDRFVAALLDPDADESFGPSSADLAETHLDEYPEEVWEDDFATGAQAL